MRSEKEEFNLEEVDVSNGYRSRSILSNGVSLELAIPRTRHQNFYSLILSLIND